jgi:hypothetical protein
VSSGFEVAYRDLRASARPLGFGVMRDRETIDSELRLLAAVRRVVP